MARETIDLRECPMNSVGKRKVENAMDLVIIIRTESQQKEKETFLKTVAFR